MTRFPYDEFAKGFFESLLSPFGDVQTSYKISSEGKDSGLKSLSAIVSRYTFG